MKKLTMRMFSMLLALVMLLGMSAAAQVERITFDLNGPDGLKLDGILSYGYDEDGCDQFSFVNSVIGKYILQSDGVDIVFGGDQIGYYTVNPDDLAEALSIVSARLSTQGMDDETIAMMDYFNSSAFEQDVEVVSQILANEVNRIASIAAQMGLVTIYENGDLQISANVEKVLELIVSYLESLSEDTDVLNAFANLGIFPVLDVPMAQYAPELPAILKDAAEQIRASASEIMNTADGGLDLYVSAETGEMTGKYYASNMINGEVVSSATETFSFANGVMTMQAESYSDGVSNKKAYTISENGFAYEEKIEYGEQNVHIACTLDQSGLVAVAEADTVSISGEGRIVVDGNGVNGSWNFAGANVLLFGSVNYDPYTNNASVKIDNKVGADSEKAIIEVTDGALNAEYTMVEGGQTVSDWTITGSGDYRINGSWIENYDVCTLDAAILVTNNGVQIEGELKNSYETNKFLYTEDIAGGKETFFVSSDTGYNKTALEMNHSVAAGVERLSVIAAVEDGDNVQKLNASVECNKRNGSLSGAFEYEENGVKFPGSFLFNEDGFEIRFSDNNMNYRIYAEGAQNAYEYILKAGLSGEELSNPGSVIDALLFVLNADTMNGFFDASFTAPMVGYFASAAFDGQAIKLEVTAEGETVTLEGKPVVTENASFFEFTGAVSGMPYEARFGMKMENASVPCLFAEAYADGVKALDVQARFVETNDEAYVEISGDTIQIEGEKVVVKIGVIAESNETMRFFAEVTGEQPDHKVGAYMPVTIAESENGISVSASLTTVQGDYVNEIGNAAVVYEYLAEVMEHVEGERLTTDMMVEILLSMLEQY